MRDESINDAIARSDRGFATWRTSPLKERAELLNCAAQLFEDRADELADIITLETGKRIPESRGEVALTASIFRYYADNIESI